MSAINDALIEVQQRLDEIAPVHEGLRDYLLLDIQPETRTEVQATLDAYDSMVGLMTAFVEAAQALLDANYPDLEPRPVSDEILNDLQIQIDTVTAARAQFKPHEADTGTMTFGPPHE